MGDNSLLIMVLKAKYGSEIIGNLEFNSLSSPHYSSLWWKDICRVVASLGSSLEWFSDGLLGSLGMGRLFAFGMMYGLGHHPSRFSRGSLLSLSKRNVLSRSSGVDTVGWSFSWRRRFFAWEDGLLVDLI